MADVSVVVWGYSQVGKTALIARLREMANTSTWDIQPTAEANAWVEAMAERREMLNLTRNDHVIGCPLCSVIPPTALELAQEELAKAQQAVARAEAAAKKVEAESSQ